MRRETKWFIIDGILFWSRRNAVTRREAWDKSIKKWKLVTRGFMAYDEMKTCGLCNVYMNSGNYDCQNCPIQQHTGAPFCKETPCASYHNTESKYDAERELKFLLDLRARPSKKK